MGNLRKNAKANPVSQPSAISTSKRTIVAQVTSLCDRFVGKEF